MPKVKKERTKYHHAAKKADSSDDEDLKELGLVFKIPPPKLPLLTENPFSGETLEDDRMSMASSRMSSRSSTSRLGRDGDGKNVTKKQRRQARREFLIQRLNISKQVEQDMKNYVEKKEKGGTAATLDMLMDSLPTQPELFTEDIIAETNRRALNPNRLTQNDCRNTCNKRGKKMVEEEVKAFQERVKEASEAVPTKLSIMDQLKQMKEKMKENVKKQNALLEESAKVAELQSAGY
ncbi:Oidioi.mRNA.OKI2018_I69.chr2.g7285.t1.cds [Oikopleura dioica]|uniref:Oidioi.mRNA.OKI2018_I69.chr2.g7285.t1.cds n=1 Tax=Oikopleura dioica TaxID=34765 RepID=A0ABN7TCD0_OIKDI|nr:Oidioi.mRNA.OKI2018_I69.chr2.g7285.t1.cds [Oikopleura dioica]